MPPMCLGSRAVPSPGSWSRTTRTKGEWHTSRRASGPGSAARSTRTTCMCCRPASSRAGRATTSTHAGPPSSAGCRSGSGRATWLVRRTDVAATRRRSGSEVPRTSTATPTRMRMRAAVRRWISSRGTRAPSGRLATASTWDEVLGGSCVPGPISPPVEPHVSGVQMTDALLISGDRGGTPQRIERLAEAGRLGLEGLMGTPIARPRAESRQG